MSTSAFPTVESILADVDHYLEEHYPGNIVEGQPAHTVYSTAAHATSDIAEKWGRDALASLQRHTEILHSLDKTHSLPLVRARLAHQPIQDLRFDFEDGYGSHDDSAEDTHARTVGTIFSAWKTPHSPTTVGVRIKGLTTGLHARSRRTLEQVFEGAGGVPAGFVFTVPKIRVPAQAFATRLLCEELEKAHGLPEGILRFELQIESPQIIVGNNGVAAIAEAIHHCGSRLLALHYGTYDYSAACGISPHHQSLKHSVADYAKAVMLAATAERGIWVSDGGSILVPEGDLQEAEYVVREHYGLVMRSLEHGYYQGWDQHPAQLPTRWLATYGFYREAFTEAVPRLTAYLTNTPYQGKLDEPATAQQLAAIILRAISVGAVSEKEVLTHSPYAHREALRSVYRRERPLK